MFTHWRFDRHCNQPKCQNSDEMLLAQRFHDCKSRHVTTLYWSRLPKSIASVHMQQQDMEFIELVFFTYGKIF